MIDHDQEYFFVVYLGYITYIHSIFIVYSQDIPICCRLDPAIFARELTALVKETSSTFRVFKAWSTTAWRSGWKNNWISLAPGVSSQKCPKSGHNKMYLVLETKSIVWLEAFFLCRKAKPDALLRSSCLILFDSHWAGGVHDVATSFGAWPCDFVSWFAQTYEWHRMMIENGTVSFVSSQQCLKSICCGLS